MNREPGKSLGCWVIIAVLGAVAILCLPPALAAQGCAMCYQTAASSTGPAREALRHGILILLVPASCLFLGVFGYLYRRNAAAR